MMTSQNDNKELQFPYRKKGKFYLSLFILFLILNILITFSFFFYHWNLVSSGDLKAIETMDKYLPFINSISVLFWILMLSFLILGVHLYYLKNYHYM